MTTIGRITIKGVRGVRSELVLDLDGRPLLMRGDNGTGKSSIAQALRWALTGTPTAADATRLPAEFQRHQLETDPDAAQVVVDLLPKGRITMRGGRTDDAETDDAGRAYMDACIRSNPFLRRDELLGFLTSSPGDRFKYLERFLDLEPVDRLLTAIGPAAKDHETAAKEAAERRARLIERSYAPLQTAGVVPSSGAELVAALRAEAARLGFATDESDPERALMALRAKLASTRANAGTAARRVELASASARARALVPPDHPRSVLDPLREAEQRAEENDLARVLTEALAVVEQHPERESCPVCEQGVEASSLASSLRARLAILNDVRTRSEEAKVLGDTWTAFLRSLHDLENVANGASHPHDALPSGRACLEHLERSGGDSLSAQTLARLDAVRSALVSAHDAIPDELRASEIGKLASAVDATLGSASAVLAAEGELALHGSRARALRAIEKAVSDARKTTAAAMLKEIEAQVASFYERIHPPDSSDEVTGAPTIKVKRVGSGTAHVRGRFNDVEVDDPRFVYSDGHLDTVGICVFLALRKQAASGAKLLVLDDVVLSIDLGHADRLVRLVREEFADHQVLLFSHNELFIRICKAPFSHAKHLEIIQWTLAHGPRIAGHVTNGEELRAKLERSGSAEQVATAMRPVLDAFLLDACSAFEVRVPLTRRRGLTVEEYWSPLRSRLTELAKAGLIPRLDGLFENIGSPSFFRNALGAHLNPWALESTLAQVQRVARGILALVEALTCTGCRTIPRLVNTRDLAQGFTCDCPRKSGPTLPHHASSTTESAS